MKTIYRLGARIIFALAIFAVLTAAILTRPPKTLTQFDQPLYFTVASDLMHYGVFGNGWFGDGERTSAGPKPGMFFGPLYPWMIVAVAKVDPRFAKAVDCGADMYRGQRPYGSCDVYVRPMLIVHAALLMVGVLAVALAAELLFAGAAVFWLAGTLATAALAAEADQFSFVMTEAPTFCLYSLTMLAMVLGWTTSKRRYFLLAGLILGIGCLARFSFLVTAFVMVALIVLHARFIARPSPGWGTASAAGFALAFLIVILPWAARNAVSVGKFALTEEYGSVTLVERFAYDLMTPREFALAFPYCLPEIGPPLVNRVFGREAMARFDYESPGSFYDIGSTRRVELVAQYTRVDPIIGQVIRDEMKQNWWRYILVSVPLAWCDMWVGGWLSLLLVPVFAVACVIAWKRRQPLFLLYAAPAVVMLGAHAALANYQTRYNLALIGPFSVAAAWLIVSAAARVRSRSQAPAPAP
jgi:hypothetical protein